MIELYEDTSSINAVRR